MVWVKLRCSFRGGLSISRGSTSTSTRATVTDRLVRNSARFASTRFHGTSRALIDRLSLGPTSPHPHR